MSNLVHINAQDRLVEESGKPTNVFFRFLQQIQVVVTSFADLDGNANDISDGDVNRFREIADMTVNRDGNGRISTIRQNGKTTTITRDVEDRVEEIEEVVDAEPTKITTRTVTRVANRISYIGVAVEGYGDDL